MTTVIKDRAVNSTIKLWNLPEKAAVFETGHSCRIHKELKMRQTTQTVPVRDSFPRMLEVFCVTSEGETKQRSVLIAP